ncbi:hypothetical protein [Bacteroides sp. 519]|uniref:hypothetical protein n=1 Tax=Bacteroides sp. 519 TaxID=2302937 RepID=UPI0013D73FB4|nr:hypothetical protein [Bacteroides sp. 519]NDV58931.1 hypothetical protein [Bacteroides sp. 519]
MKRTTYILIGVYLGGMLFILVGIISLISYFGKELDYQTIDMPQTTATTELDGVKKVVVSSIYPVRFRMPKNGDFKVTQAPVGSTGKITYPASEYIKVKKQNDVLFLKVDFETLGADSEFSIAPVDIQLEIPETFIRIENKSITDMTMESVTIDSLEIDTERGIYIENCTIGSLVLSEQNRYLFSGTNTTIQNLYADLDGLREWKFSNCTIQNQHLTANGSAQLPYNGKGTRIFWKPKNDKATLSLTREAKIVVE